MHAWIALAVLVVLPRIASADYDKTAWGMTLPKVQKLYPGGVTKNRGNGVLDYLVVKDVGSITDTVVAFRFERETGLTKVVLRFTEYNKETDLQRDSVPTPSSRYAAYIVQAITGRLTLKYGKPLPRHADGYQGFTDWQARGNFVQLRVDPEGSTNTSVTLTYRQSDRERHTGDGL